MGDVLDFPPGRVLAGLVVSAPEAQRGRGRIDAFRARIDELEVWGRSALGRAALAAWLEEAGEFSAAAMREPAAVRMDIAIAPRLAALREMIAAVEYGLRLLPDVESLQDVAERDAGVCVPREEEPARPHGIGEMLDLAALDACSAVYHGIAALMAAVSALRRFAAALFGEARRRSGIFMHGRLLQVRTRIERLGAAAAPVTGKEEVAFRAEGGRGLSDGGSAA